VQLKWRPSAKCLRFAGRARPTSEREFDSREPGYTINSSPVAFGKSGHRTFYAEESMVIHQNWELEPASAESPKFKYRGLIAR